MALRINVSTNVSKTEHVKLLRIARREGFVKGSGAPNLSKMLNSILVKLK